MDTGYRVEREREKERGGEERKAIFLIKILLISVQ